MKLVLPVQIVNVLPDVVSLSVIVLRIGPNQCGNTDRTRIINVIDRSRPSLDGRLFFGADPS